MAFSETYDVSYKGPVRFTLQGENYEAVVDSTSEYYHQYQVLYFKDGTGQPEDEDWSVKDVKITKVLKEDQTSIGVWDDVTDLYNSNIVFKSEVDDEVWDELESNWGDYDWVGDEPDNYEPDYEPDEDY